MATLTTCDGTGKAIPEDTPTTGHFGHQYCDAARAVAEAYLAEVDALHSEMAHAFAEDLALIREKYAEKLATLPDAP